MGKVQGFALSSFYHSKTKYFYNLKLFSKNHINSSEPRKDVHHAYI